MVNHQSVVYCFRISTCTMLMFPYYMFTHSGGPVNGHLMGTLESNLNISSPFRYTRLLVR